MGFPPCVCRTEFFPKTPYITRGTPVELNTTSHYGPWSVTARVVESGGEDSGKRVTIQDVMAGDFQYELMIREGQQLLLDPEARVQHQPFRGLIRELRLAVPVVTCVDEGAGRPDVCVRVHCVFKHLRAEISCDRLT